MSDNFERELHGKARWVRESACGWDPPRDPSVYGWMLKEGDLQLFAGQPMPGVPSVHWPRGMLDYFRRGTNCALRTGAEVSPTAACMCL